MCNITLYLDFTLSSLLCCSFFVGLKIKKSESLRKDLVVNILFLIIPFALPFALSTLNDVENLSLILLILQNETKMKQKKKNKEEESFEVVLEKTLDIQKRKKGEKIIFIGDLNKFPLPFIDSIEYLMQYCLLFFQTAHLT